MEPTMLGLRAQSVGFVGLAFGFAQGHERVEWRSGEGTRALQSCERGTARERGGPS